MLCPLKAVPETCHASCRSLLFDGSLSFKHSGGGVSAAMCQAAGGRLRMLQKDVNGELADCLPARDANQKPTLAVSCSNCCFLRRNERADRLCISSLPLMHLLAEVAARQQHVSQGR